MVYFLYFIVAYSISFLFVYAEGPFDIIDKLRNVVDKIAPSIGKVFDCMYCFPTWVGLCLSGANQLFLHNVPLTPFFVLLGTTCPWYVIVILDVFVTNGMVYITDCIIKRIINDV